MKNLLSPSRLKSQAAAAAEGATKLLVDREPKSQKKTDKEPPHWQRM